MTPLLPTALLLALAACRAPDPGAAPAGEPSPPAHDAPSPEGPVLCGTVSHPSGRPLAGVLVTTHGGFATRFPGRATRTDAEGRYRIFPVEGSLIGDDDGVWDLYVGVCVGSVQGANPAEYLPWKDVRVPQDPGTVVRLDFEFDPESVPPEVRGG